MGKFEISDQFYLDGKPFTIISGAIHYVRVVPDYWRDRLEKLKAMGCNTVETYLPWNLHEPEEGRFVFEGALDVRRFLQIAADLGLYAIVRPSPYVCGEWEFGGLPPWLLQKENMWLRSAQGSFLKYVARYYEQLFPILSPLQIDYGGNVILLQVENEYGAYGDEKGYMNELADLMRKQGAVVPFVTSDGPWSDYLECGSIAQAHPTANFGSHAKERLSILEKHTRNGPLMCMEFWTGWFDYWGCGHHNVTSPEQSAAELDEILSRGSVNFYMFHGGTNFGFLNGSNYKGFLMPDVTSYDYDAPLSEDGQITEKYKAYAEVIAKYNPIPDVPLSTDIKRIRYGALRCVARTSLFEVLDNISKPVESMQPLSMEALGQNFGYTLYRSRIPAGRLIEKMQLLEANDRAQLFLDGTPKLTLYDRELLPVIETQWQFDTDTAFDILVENMGRVNYGPCMMRQRKGIAGGVFLNDHGHSGWTQYPLPLEPEDIEKLDFAKPYHEGTPAFHLFTWDAQEQGDTFLDVSGWGKGCAFINGFNLGRFWSAGPQKRLYIPGPLIQKGANRLVLFETEGLFSDRVSLEDAPDLGSAQTAGN